MSYSTFSDDNVKSRIVSVASTNIQVRLILKYLDVIIVLNFLISTFFLPNKTNRIKSRFICAMQNFASVSKQTNNPTHSYLFISKKCLLILWVDVCFQNSLKMGQPTFRKIFTLRTNTNKSLRSMSHNIYQTGMIRTKNINKNNFITVAQLKKHFFSLFQKLWISEMLEILIKLNI